MLVYFAMAFLIFEAFKLFIEIIAIRRNEKLEGNLNPNDVTFIISAWNEQDMIYDTIKSIYPYKVIIGDDGSTDNTVNEIKRYQLDYPNRNVRLILKSNSGKVNTIKQLMRLVDTEYVVIADADIVLDKNFNIPELGDATAMSFNVRPLNNKKIVEQLQDHEYQKSMDIGRASKNATRTVHCISGAIGLFRTSRLLKLTTKHKGNYQGEDLSRTLIELLHQGKVIHCDSLVYTDVPNNWKLLIKQRIKYWNPGLHFNTMNMIHMIFKHKIKWRLRIEMIYEVLSNLTDPLKFIFLFLTSWWILALIYVYYLIFEIFIKKSIKSSIKYKTLLLYPLYNLMLLITRILSIPYSIKLIIKYNFNMHEIKKSYRLRRHSTKIFMNKVVFIISLLLLSIITNAQNIEIKSESFYYNDKFKHNAIIYMDLNSWYAEGSIFENKSIILGKWINDGYIYGMYKDNFTKLSGKIQLDNYKSYPMQYFLISNIVYLIEEQKLIEVIGVSLQYIQGNTSIETMIGYENGYKYLPYIGEKLKYKNLAITTFYNSGFSYAFDYKIKQFTTSINYEHDYDFTKKSKTLITIGYKFKYLK